MKAAVTVTFGLDIGANKRKAKRLANRAVRLSRRLQRRIGYDADTARNCEWLLRRVRYSKAAKYCCRGAV